MTDDHDDRIDDEVGADAVSPVPAEIEAEIEIETTVSETPATDDVLVLQTWQIQLPATGDDQVDAALALLSDVEGLPPAQHADVYEAVHAGLQDALADLDRA